MQKSTTTEKAPASRRKHKKENHAGVQRNSINYPNIVSSLRFRSHFCHKVGVRERKKSHKLEGHKQITSTKTEIFGFQLQKCELEKLSECKRDDQAFWLGGMSESYDNKKVRYCDIVVTQRWIHYFCLRIITHSFNKTARATAEPPSFRGTQSSRVSFRNQSELEHDRLHRGNR